MRFCVSGVAPVVTEVRHSCFQAAILRSDSHAATVRFEAGDGLVLAWLAFLGKTLFCFTEEAAPTLSDSKLDRRFRRGASTPSNTEFNALSIDSDASPTSSLNLKLETFGLEKKLSSVSKTPAYEGLGGFPWKIPKLYSKKMPMIKMKTEPRTKWLFFILRIIRDPSNMMEVGFCFVLPITTTSARSGQESRPPAKHNVTVHPVVNGGREPE